MDTLKADKLNNSNDYNNTYSTLQNQFDDFKLITKDEFKTFFAAINFNLNPAKWIIKNNFIQPAIAYTSGSCVNNYHVDALSSSSVYYLKQTYNYGHHYRKGSGGAMASSMGCSFYDYTGGKQFGDNLYCVIDCYSNTIGNCECAMVKCLTNDARTIHIVDGESAVCNYDPRYSDTGNQSLSSSSSGTTTYTYYKVGQGPGDYSTGANKCGAVPNDTYYCILQCSGATNGSR